MNSDEREQSGVLDSFIEKERMLEPNPFMATRILQHIDTKLGSREQNFAFRFVKLVSPTMIVLGFALAIFAGYTLGKPRNIHSVPGPVNAQAIETLKGEMFIHDFVDEDKIFASNN